MAKTLEQLADEIYKECLEDNEPVTREEALKMAQMELGAKQIKTYVQSTPTKKKTVREIKPDDTKVELISQISKLLDRIVINDNGLNDVRITKAQREIDFILCNEHYTLTLVKHRPPKK